MSELSREERRDRVVAMRSEVPPRPWIQIGEELGISYQAAQKLYARATQKRNARGEVVPVKHDCAVCRKPFYSVSLTPGRCTACGTYRWRTGRSTGKREK